MGRSQGRVRGHISSTGPIQPMVGMNFPWQPPVIKPGKKKHIVLTVWICLNLQAWCFFQFDTRYFPAKHVADLQRGHFLLARSRTLFVSILPVAGHYPLFRCWLISFDGYIFVDEHPPPKKHINPVNDTPHISQCPTKSYMTLATLAAHSTEWSAISRLSDGPAYNGGRT
jgi:hypothetical protein